MNYPISEKLRSAMVELFEDPSTGLGLLGVVSKSSEKDLYSEKLDSKLSIEDRLIRLRHQLEEYICNMSDEHLEYECESETERLRAEARALLIVLREIFWHFPEVFK